MCLDGIEGFASKRKEEPVIIPVDSVVTIWRPVQASRQQARFDSICSRRAEAAGIAQGIDMLLVCWKTPALARFYLTFLQKTKKGSTIKQPTCGLTLGRLRTG